MIVIVLRKMKAIAVWAVIINGRMPGGFVRQAGICQPKTNLKPSSIIMEAKVPRIMH